MYRNLFFLLLILVLTSCREDELDYIIVNPEVGWFPELPVNITNLNTTFDDYNSNLEGQAQRINLYYSTNYPKKGADYDIKGVVIDILMNDEKKQMSFSIANDYPDYSLELLPLINSSANEFGPFSFYSDENHNDQTNWFFFYANDENGQYDIKFAWTNLGDWDSYNDNSQINGPFYAEVLNSNVCDFYPTINSDHSKMYFSSYQKGKYDIYEIACDNTNFISWLKEGTNSALLNQTLSSEGDDKCPYINGKLMVFASDNPEGYGGYDLWYSVFENGEWSKPINFGPDINTQHDEYRPAIEYIPDSNNDLMIFSSNRPGGRGGYDLYYVGISKMIE